ncbi:hypothetical protein R6Q59_022001 [Mikania micrantha]
MDACARIINELTQGMDYAMQLKSVLSSESHSETKHVLIHHIISSYDRAILMVNQGEYGGQTQPMLAQPELSVSIESPRSPDANQPLDDQQEDKVVSKKSKAMPTWENHIRISTDSYGLEGNTDDGYSWRKYGQKDILGSKFPRSYYRCSYRYIHQCMAKKQVQRTNEDPTVFEVTYKGQHTCNPTTAPEKHETQQNSNQLLLTPRSEDLIVSSTSSGLDATVPRGSFSFPSPSFGSIQQTQFLNETDYFGVLQGYSPSFIAPGFQHHDESDLSAGINDADLAPLAFPADPQQDLSQNFPFNKSSGPGYFM